MKKSSYTPQPIDTSDIELPSELLPLVEQIARNVHEVWADHRIRQGWTLGPRSDAQKTHPCLVPFDQLTEQEKDYDRNTAMSTLRLTMKLGFQIKRNDSQ